MNIIRLKKTGTIILITLIIAITFTFLPTYVKASSIEITSISPEDQHGRVGDAIRIVGTINTTNGPYRILFDARIVNETYASENAVNASFPVPHSPKGNYTITLQDITANGNATTWFYIETAYYIKAIAPSYPEQLQQNCTVEIQVNVTGGEQNKVYSANVTVTDPTNKTCWDTATLTNTTDTGHGYNLTTIYPFPDANTNFTGVYTISFNQTPATDTFFIGLTNSSEYHRGDSVDIKAVDYPPNQNVTLTIKFGNKIIDSMDLNVTVDGVVHTNWTIPSNATRGSYTLSIIPVPDSKQEANDTQIFEVPGFEIKVFTRNLANEIVPNIFIKAHDESADTYYNATSDKDGLASFMFERGNYSCEVFFKEVRVNSSRLSIDGESEWSFRCQITNLNIKVVDAQNVSIPQVSISLIYNYTTNLDEKENRTETLFGETSIAGILQLRSLLPNTTCTINASRYGEIFNQDNNTVSDLPARAWVNVTILCPAKTLYVNVTDAHNQPVKGIQVKAQELMGGLCYNNVTDDNGKAILKCTFGRYLINTYMGEILLNETGADLFQNRNVSIICKLYGLTVSVRVVDYFGQPISNANVELQREGLSISPKRTESNGTATFPNLIGGNLSVSVYLAGQTQPCVTGTYLVEEAKTIEVRIGKYVVLAGFLVETSQLTTAMIIAAAVILTVLIEVYRRKRLKPQKSSA